ncbi:hypothetical protein HZA33_05220 [Candidatus Pacearchaeota archaeon]|nr:hypothetical protein [Candidatus Pacearchaeota archaeon]
MKEIKCKTIGEAWLESCSQIFRKGKPVKDGDKDIREIIHLAVKIKNPLLRDRILKQYSDNNMIEWMNSNFFEQKRVPELKNALSYGTRLFNFDGKNQIEWVKQKLRDKPECKSATISTIMKDDSDYIPCVSMLDFKIRNNKLMLVAFCRSIDFGKKVYANMISLNEIQNNVASALKIKCGELVMYVVSAHIYDEDYDKLKEILKNAGKY